MDPFRNEILVLADVLLTATGKQTVKEMKTKAANNKTFMVSLFFFLKTSRRPGLRENVGFILSKIRVE